MANQSANPGGGRNQDGALRSPVSSICGTADRFHKTRVFGPHIVLDDHRSRKQAARVSELLQRASLAHFTGATNARSAFEWCATARRSALLPMAIALPGALSDSRDCLIFRILSLPLSSLNAATPASQKQLRSWVCDLGLPIGRTRCHWAHYCGETAMCSREPTSRESVTVSIRQRQPGIIIHCYFMSS
jgi:hypothetical protein